MSVPTMRMGWTADAIAAARAMHSRYESPVVFRDDVAIDLLSPVGRFFCQSPLVYRLVLDPMFSRARAFIFHSFCCQRYAEDQLLLATERGTTQYVILGAGLDSFALRHPHLTSALRVFEIDHPTSQEVKRQRIASSTHALPDNLEFVSVDFEEETMLDGLRRSRFDFARPAYCSWLGTVQYLTLDAVFGTLEAVASLAPGTDLVFNYFAPHESLDDAEMEEWVSLQRKLRLGAAPLRSEFAPDQIAAEASGRGFDVVTHWSAKELDEQYLQGWKDLHTIPSARMIHLRTRA